MAPELPAALLDTRRFEVRDCLGAGGFGVVYAAYDRERKAEVALKWLRHSDVPTITRFKREFRALADTKHPNLIAFRDLFTVGGEWFFTMDLIDGVSLSRFVRSTSLLPLVPTTRTSSEISLNEVAAGRAVTTIVEADATFSPEEVGSGTHRPLCLAVLPRLLQAFEQLAAGLMALHTAGLIHRDVKPSNVLVDGSSRVVILDFGLVTDMTEEGTSNSTSGQIVGTPVYMSPEQGLGLRLTPASDWYAVGAMLYEVLTGKVPFDGTTNAVLIGKQLADPLSPLTIVRGVPKQLAELTIDLLARRPEKRPTGKEFVERLRAALPTFGPAGPDPEAPAVPAAFVGREAHLWALDEALEETTHDRAVVALVHGPSGMGKSALVRHFLQVVRRDRPDVTILEGRCYEREAVPYKAFDSLIDALCRMLLRLPEHELAGIMPRAAGSLARVFPAFRQLQLEAPRRTRAPADAVQERRRAFEALRELFARMANKRPLVLFIDDVQWGDQDSEAVLHALFRPPDPPPLLLIGAYRDEDASGAPLVRALRRLAGEGESIAVCEVPVSELPDEAARELAAALLPLSVSESVVDELAREAAGSPLFLRQLVALGGDGAIDLAAAIRRRVAALPDPSRRLLEVLAVAGQPTTPAVAAKSAGIEDDMDGVVAHLRSATLVRTRASDGEETLEVYHDRIKEVVVGDLGDARVAELHGRLARGLTQSGEGDAEALASHFRAAGDFDKAARYAEEAAKRAIDALAFDRAARFYEMAIELHSSAQVTPPSLLLRLAETLVAAGRGREAAGQFLIAARSASAVDALDLRRRAAEQLLLSGHIDDGIRLVDEILPAMKMRAPKRLGAILLSLAWHRFLIWLTGYRFRERTEDQIPRDRLVRIDTCFSFGLGLGLVDLWRGADFQARFLLLALRAGEPSRVARALALEGPFRAAAGGKARSVVERLHTRATVLAERLSNPHASALITLMRGIAISILGDYAQSIELCDQAAVEFRERCSGVAWELDNAAFFSGFALGMGGRFRDLRERLPALLEDVRSRGDLYGEVVLRANCSWLDALARDDADGAAAELRFVEERWSKERFLLQHVWIALGRTDILLYRGEASAAYETMRRLQPQLESHRYLWIQAVRVRTMQARARAAIALAMATPNERASLLAEAETLANGIGRETWPLGKGWSHLLHAAIADARGDRAASLGRATLAAAELDARDARIYAAAARVREGTLRGGEEGVRLEAAGAATMYEQGIADPMRFLRMLAPFLETA